MTTALAITALVCGVLAVVAEVGVRRRMLYVFKPLTMISIIVMLAASPGAAGPHQPGYRWLILAALVCSLAGDVFLMLESDRFVAGVASFLVAHLFYIVAFGFGLMRSTARPSLATVASVAAIVALYAGVVMRSLWAKLGEMRVPVAVYVGVISVMLATAATAWLAGAGVHAGWAFMGAVCFVASDTTLAFYRFAGLRQRAHVFILGAYFVAQYLIATSAAG